MKKLVVLLLAVLLVPATQSCKKKAKDNGASKEKILTNGDWNYTKQAYYDANGNLTNTFQINHVVKFKSGGTYERYDGNGQLLDSGTWELKNNGAKIHIHTSGYDENFDIIKLNNTEFIYQWTNSQAGNKIKYYLER